MAVASGRTDVFQSGLGPLMPQAWRFDDDGIARPALRFAAEAYGGLDIPNDPVPERRDDEVPLAVAMTVGGAMATIDPAAKPIYDPVTQTTTYPPMWMYTGTQSWEYTSNAKGTGSVKGTIWGGSWWADVDDEHTDWDDADMVVDD
jgi:hypothetical protein